MVRKGVLFLASVFSLVLVLALSFVSAGFFSNMYKGITGQSITGEVITISYSCSDTDATGAHPSGDNKLVKGTTTRKAQSGASIPGGIETNPVGFIPDNDLTLPPINFDEGFLGDKGEIINIGPAITPKVGIFTKIKNFFSPIKTKLTIPKNLVKTSPKLNIPSLTGRVVSGTSETDVCVNSNRLREFYCEGSNIKNKTYDCECSGDKCVVDEEEEALIAGAFAIPTLPVPCKPLSETDSGGLIDSKRWNYIEKGKISDPSWQPLVEDECMDVNRLKEYACYTGGNSTQKEVLQSRIVDCIYGCDLLRGRCNTCTDTDQGFLDGFSFGRNPFDVGVTRYSEDGVTELNPAAYWNFQRFDSCKNSTTLEEKYCQWNPGSPYTRESYNVTCDNGCESGFYGVPDKCKALQGSTQIQLKSPVNNFVFGKTPIDFVCDSGLWGFGVSNVTFYTDMINGTFKEYYTLNDSDGYNCGGDKCFKFTIPKPPAGIPTPVFPDGIYKWSCKANIFGTMFWANENRTFYLANGTLLIYNGGMITPNWTAVEDVPSTTPKDISQFDNFLTLYINGSTASKTGIIYSVNTSPNIDVVFNSRTSVNITPKANFNGHAEIIFLATNGSKSIQMNPLGVDVSGLNDAPVIVNTLIQWRVNNSTLVELNGNYFTDPEGNSMTYTWTSAENISIINLTSSLLNFSSSSGFVGYRYIKITANDSGGASTTANVTLKVSDSNHAPVINSYSPNSTTLTSALNQKTYFSVNASDPDGDPITYSWNVYKSNGSFVTSSTNQSFSFSSTSPGSYTVKIIISDGEFSKYNSWVLVIGSGEDDSETGDCGNGQIDVGEVCDGGLLNGATCQTQGYDSGELSCSSNCESYDKILCTLEDTNEEEPTDLGEVKEKSNMGTFLIWGLIIILLILIIVGTILIIRIIKKRNAAKASAQTWQQTSRPTGGSTFPSR